MDRSRAGLLLAGPQGRALCIAVVFSAMTGADADRYEALTSTPSGTGWLPAGSDTDAASAALAAAINTQLAEDLHRIDRRVLLEHLADVVSNATHWGPPDEDAVAAADPIVVEALTPTAHTLAAAPAAQWWDRPLVADDQHYVSWLDDHQTRASPPPLTGAAERLTAWRRHTQQPAQLWWSTPDHADVVSTSASFDDLPALQLALVEDPLGWDRARVARLQPNTQPRVYEINGPDTWAGLVETYPLDVSASRGENWRRLTGQSGPWLIPNWARVAADYDAVHLTTVGYLSTAGQVLQAAGGRTVLAGWEPDVTIWLTDILTQAEETATWIAGSLDAGYTAWKRAPTGTGQGEVP